MILAATVVAVLILVNAFYVAAEFATVSVRASRIRQLAEAGHATARRLAAILADGERLDRYVAACQIGITVSSLILGAYVQAAYTAPFADALQRLAGLDTTSAFSTAAVTLLVGLTLLQVVFGELVPKSLALQYPTRTALLVLRPMELSLGLFHWFNLVLNGSGMLILRAMGMKQTSHRHIHSPEEIELLLIDSRDGGQLEPDEQRRLHQGLQLCLRPAESLMVPRRHVEALDLDEPVEALLQQALDSPYTRLPVYRGSLDQVQGILHTKDLAGQTLAGQVPADLTPLLRPPVYVPKTITGDRLLATLRQQHSQMALVVDEFGGLAGLVSLEDVLEYLMGLVADASRFGQPNPERLADGRIRLPGLMRLEETANWLGTAWQGEAHTVGGHLTSVLGRIPDPGERLQVDGHTVEVEAVRDHAVTSVLVTPPGGDGHG